MIYGLTVKELQDAIKGYCPWVDVPCKNCTVYCHCQTNKESLMKWDRSVYRTRYLAEGSSLDEILGLP